MDYLDFDLDIQPAPDNHYVVSVRSPAGEAQETVALAYDPLTLDNRLKDVQIALLQAGSRRRQVLQPAEQTVQRFGAELFDLLLTGNIRNRYDVSLAQAQIQQKGLRLRLCVDAPSLAALPWEFLYDARRGDHLCLSYDTPLVRYLRLAQPTAPLPVTPPLRILAMAVSPSDLPALDLAAERQRMERALQPLQAQGLVELVWLPGESWRALRTALVDNGPWHIFHFIGHGGFDANRDEGVLMFADGEGRAQSQTATNIGHLLADHTSLRLALLNACEGAKGSDRDLFSSTAATLVRRGLPAVIAMQYPITDTAAIQFTQEFYGQIAVGQPIDAAVAEARLAMIMETPHSLEWGTPVLYTHTTDGRIFDMALSKENAKAAAAILARPELVAAEPRAAVAVAQPPAASIPGGNLLRYGWVAGVVLLLATIVVGVILNQPNRNVPTVTLIPTVAESVESLPITSTSVATVATSAELAPLAAPQEPTTSVVAATAVPTPDPLQNKRWVAFVAVNASDDLLISSSEDGGIWSENVRVGKASKAAPALTKFKGKLYLAYLDAANELQMTTSATGAAWQSKSSITNLKSMHAPALTVFNDQLYLVYVTNDLAGQLAVITSPDGVDWSPPTILSVHSAVTPAVTVWQCALTIAFIEDDDKHRVKLISSQDGKTWSDPVDVGVQSTLAPAIAPLYDRLYLAYITDDDDNQLMVTSSSNGVAWSNSRSVRSESSVRAPAMGIFDDKLQIAIIANDGTNKIILFSSSDGEIWSKPQSIEGEHSKRAVSLVDGAAVPPIACSRS